MGNKAGSARQGGITRGRKDMVQIGEVLIGDIVWPVIIGAFFFAPSNDDPHLPVPLSFHLIFVLLFAFELVIGHPMKNALRLSGPHHVQDALVYQSVPGQKRTYLHAFLCLVISSKFLQRYLRALKLSVMVSQLFHVLLRLR